MSGNTRGKTIPWGIFIIFLFGITMVALGAIFVNAAEYPNLNGQRVSDFANTMSASDVSNLAAEINDIELATGIEIAIVTVESTEGQGRVLYANYIGDQNGVGKADLDNGIVVLWSLDNEKGGAIATGRGIGDVLNDAKVSRLGRESRPYFDEGDYYQGFHLILVGISQELNASGTTTEKESFETTYAALPGWTKVLLWILGIIVLLVIIAGASSGSSGGGSSGFAGGYVGGSGGWSGGGGGGFSGGGFGGGGGGF